MAPGTGDKEQDQGQDEARHDEVGPRQPRWAAPRPKSPIAVALDYKQPDGRIDARKAPRVAATGRGAVAEQILEIAFARGIPVREDPDLAQILATLDVDSVIPIDALSAVAEILSYLYRLNGKAMDGHPLDDADRDNARAGEAGVDEAGAGESGDRR